MVIRKVMAREGASGPRRSAGCGAQRRRVADISIALAMALSSPAGAAAISDPRPPLEPAVAAAPPAGPEAVLAQGREALARGDLRAALAAYRPISVAAALWPEKAEDLVRYQLLARNPSEAWRLVQVARRVSRASDSLRDYEKLAIFEAGACPLALPGDDEAADALLNAAVYRNAETLFARAGAGDNPDALTSLAPGLTPYLADIPSTQVLKGRGCRLAKLTSARSALARQRSEMRELARFLSAPANANHAVDLVGRLLALARAASLATELSDDRAVALFSSMLPAEKDVPWARLPDPERRYFFTRYFDGPQLDALPEGRRAAAQTIALEILRASPEHWPEHWPEHGSERVPELQASDANSSAGSFAAGGLPVNARSELGAWLAFVDLDRLPAREQALLLSRAEKSGAFEGRAWVLYRLARAQQESGATSDALTSLRRILVENEEPEDGALEGACIELAARIFSERQLDARIMGALQAAVPSRLWGSLLEQARLRAAFEGRSRDLARLMEIARKRGAGVGGSSLALAPAWQMLQSIARRGRSAFERALRPASNPQTRAVEFVAGSLARYLAGASGRGAVRAAPERAALLPFAQSLARWLASKAQGRPELAESGALADLSTALAADGAASGEWSVGAGVARKRALAVGVAKAAAEPPAPSALKIEAPATLPLRRLLFLPADVATRRWIFSAATQ